MTFTKVFKSTHPDVLKNLDEWKQSAKQFEQQLNDFEDRYEAKTLYFPADCGLPARMLGISPKQEGQPIPSGWRRNKSQYWWVPDKRTKAGKALHDEISKVTCVSQLALLKSFIQVDVMIPGHWYTAGCREINAVVYVTHAEAFTFIGNEYFEPVKLSEYYALLEETDSEVTK